MDFRRDVKADIDTARRCGLFFGFHGLLCWDLIFDPRKSSFGFGNLVLPKLHSLGVYGVGVKLAMVLQIADAILARDAKRGFDSCR